jgi:hypothetical protein
MRLPRGGPTPRSVLGATEYKDMTPMGRKPENTQAPTGAKR